jgi:hypothetical protein
VIIALTLCERGKRRKQRKKGKTIGDIRTLMIILWYSLKDFDKINLIILRKIFIGD